MHKIDLKQTARRNKKQSIVRRFTIQALENCETLMLTMEELEKLRLEFPEIFTELFQGAHERL
jgi:predicted DNA-binding protein (UPF0251 family)